MDKSSQAGFIAKIAAAGAVVVAIILVAGTWLMGQSAQQTTDDAVRSVSMFYLDELVGRREQVVETNLENKLDNMRSAISGVINQIVSTIRNGLNQAVSFVKGLIGQAFSWGRDLIMGIVNGIRNAIGAVANACRSVADTIRSYLHFSVPDIGPLTDYESWMPDFMKGLAKGIEKSKGLVSDAMEGVTAGMNLSPVLAASAPAMAESVTRGGDAGLLQRLSDAVSQLSGQNGDITIPVYIGQDRIDEIVVTAAQRATYRSGGR